MICVDTENEILPLKFTNLLIHKRKVLLPTCFVVSQLIESFCVLVYSFFLGGHSFLSQSKISLLILMFVNIYNLDAFHFNYCRSSDDDVATDFPQSTLSFKYL